MLNHSLLPDVSEGNAEPPTSRIITAILGVGLIGLLGMSINIFGMDNIPVLSQIIPFMDNLGGSGIWYYLIGILAGLGAIVANMLAGVVSD